MKLIHLGIYLSLWPKNTHKKNQLISQSKYGTYKRTFKMAIKKTQGVNQWIIILLYLNYYYYLSIIYIEPILKEQIREVLLYIGLKFNNNWDF